MAEWRIFMEIDKEEFEKVDKDGFEGCKNPEKRTDTYILLYSNYELNLKYRGNSSLELKTRYNKENGIEYWNKTYYSNVPPLKDLTLEKLKDSLKGCKNSKLIEALEKIECKERPWLCQTEKIRTTLLGAENAVMKISFPSLLNISEPFFYKSICAESFFKTSQIIEKYKEKYNKYECMGYNQFLCKLANEKIETK